jgi:hypothetical protein
MNEKELDDIIAKSRKRHGFSPLTPDEAEVAYENAQEEPLPKDFIDSVLQKVSGDTEKSWEPPVSYDWLEDSDYSEVEDGVLQLHRNKGEDDSDVEESEEELRNELLSDDDDEDGMDGETESSR